MRAELVRVALACPWIEAGAIRLDVTLRTK